MTLLASVVLFAIARTHADAVAGTIPVDNGGTTMVSKIEQRRRARQRAMSIAEFCERYGLGRTKTYEELKCGRLRGRKIGRRTIITEDDAEDWLRHLPAMEVVR